MEFIFLAGYRFGSCFCIIAWINVLASHNSSRCWIIFNVFVWWFDTFQRFPLVRYSTNCEQGSNSSKLYRSEIRSNQFVSRMEAMISRRHNINDGIFFFFIFQGNFNLHGYIEHLHSNCQYFGWSRWKPSEINEYMILGFMF